MDVAPHRHHGLARAQYEHLLRRYTALVQKAVGEGAEIDVRAFVEEQFPMALRYLGAARMSHDPLEDYISLEN